MPGEIHQLKCLFVLPSIREPQGELYAALERGAQRAGFEVLRGYDPRVDLFTPGDDGRLQSALKADLIIADVSDPDPTVFLEIGAAQAAGKPILFLLREDQPAPPNLLRWGSWITYEPQAGRSIPTLVRNLTVFLKEFKERPKQFRPFRASPLLDTPRVIDIGKLNRSELENLCFELLTQMGFQNLDWGSRNNIKAVDVVASLSKSDPDGFEYFENWFVWIGLNKGMSFIKEAIDTPDQLRNQVLLGLSPADRAWDQVRSGGPLTLLLILTDERADPIRRELTRRRHQLGRTATESGIRIRLWDKQTLSQLVQSHPQLAYKYFSDEGRSQSKYRKSPEELYRENVDLNERLQVTVKALKEERDLRVLAERDAVWKDLAFVAAHKLGNPVFALETALGGLKAGVSEHEGRIIGIVNGMGDSIEKAKTIIEQFKSLNKAQEITAKPIEIGSLLHTAARVAEEKGVKVHIDAPANLPKVLADAGRISECLDELVANALHWFSDSKRILIMSASLPQRAEVPKQLDHSRKFLRLRVQDNGCGIEVDRKAKIFDPFETTYPHGTGLGLAVVKRIVEGHDGFVHEIGTLGEGAIFEIFLPLPSTA